MATSAADGPSNAHLIPTSGAPHRDSLLCLGPRPGSEPGLRRPSRSASASSSTTRDGRHCHPLGLPQAETALQLPTGDHQLGRTWSWAAEWSVAPMWSHATLTVYKSVIMAPAEPLTCAMLGGRGWVRTNDFCRVKERGHHARLRPTPRRTTTSQLSGGGGLRGHGAVCGVARHRFWRISGKEEPPAEARCCARTSVLTRLLARYPPVLFIRSIGSHGDACAARCGGLDLRLRGLVEWAERRRLGMDHQRWPLCAMTSSSVAIRLCA
jgi:hypothetical protein